ncbi:BMC_2a_G0022930.mRNA.1.CDS.1 [Saccharomyces cerevisiae]|nr:Clb6p [Saccharomyces cerevisiae YJM1447]CAI4465205.1 BMC_2a_G0022930.mRNA.1.CDS.1 [Saccharomyces cerevisiae]CAI4469997.1 BMB_G0022960.mRNA.1.CDS.1 [Saccharomyces cerevisiae]CAI7118440.1 BMC_2a_G0022930.mRNA.1.CDS.1 [Saccharomyces cerevisiae]CAI7119739.1 BMB_G0022960.mRNA.1.CDS.1 [Saccharomyces cerevisiae]
MNCIPSPISERKIQINNEDCIGKENAFHTIPRESSINLTPHSTNEKKVLSEVNSNKIDSLQLPRGKLQRDSTHLEKSRKRQLSNDSTDPIESKTVKKIKCHQWKNLDSMEMDDPFMVAEYTDSIFSHLYEKEIQMLPTHNYLMDTQSPYYLKSSMRALLIDWLVEVHEKFHCLPETLFLAINLLDRFLSQNVVKLNKLQLLCITCLFIACKFEEVKLPKITNFAYVTDGAATVEGIRKAELFVLSSLGYNISLPNPLNFIRRISKADNYCIETRNMAKFIMEYSICCNKLIHLKPSYLAAMSMYIARKIKNENSKWDETFIHYSGGIDIESDPAFKDFISELVEDIAVPDTNLDSLRLKYKKPKHGMVYFKVFDWCKQKR